MPSSFTNLMRRFLGSKDREAATEESADAVEYEGYRIRPTSRKQGSQWLTAGTISKTFAAGAPMCCWYQIQASGLIGSPTVPSRRIFERSYDCGISSPSFISARIAVGAV